MLVDRHVVERQYADASLATDVGTAAVLSPDGQTLAFAAQKSNDRASQLYVRRLEQLQATPLAGTEDARGPFFSRTLEWATRRPLANSIAHTSGSPDAAAARSGR